MKTAFHTLRQSARWLTVTLLLSVLASWSAHAELVLVVSNRSSIEHLSREQTINIFMGRYRKAPNDTTIRPLDLEKEAPERRLFYRQLIDKSLEEVNAYWARLMFSGRTAPPIPVKGQTELLDILLNDPATIGYVDRSWLNSMEGNSRAKSLRIVFALPI